MRDNLNPAFLLKKLKSPRISFDISNKKCYNKSALINRGVAQLVARLVRDQEVGCSSHLTPTIFLYFLGEMSEWLNEHDWKSCLPKGNAGSNPVLSAIKTHTKGALKFYRVCLFLYFYTLL